MNDRSRIYTNVILTVIAVLLAVIALKPSNPFVSDAQAQLIPERERNAQRQQAYGDQYVVMANTLSEAIRGIADANKEIAGSVDKMSQEMHFIGQQIKEATAVSARNQNQ